MELVHSVWKKDNFYIWVETFDSLFGRKDFQTEKRTIANSRKYPNARNINQILKILRIAGLEDIKSNVVKASTIDINFPNNDFEVEALAIPSLEIMDFLLQQLENKIEYFSLSESTKFWMGITKFVLEIITEDKFLPYVHVENRNTTETSFLGKWKAIIDLNIESKLVQFSQELIDSNFDVNLDFLTARELILSFINTLLDSFIRNKLGVFLPKYKNDIDIQTSEIARDWFQSLFDSNMDTLVYSTNEVDVFLGTLNAWLNNALPRKNINPFRLCLKLSPPCEETTDVDESVWKLEYHLQAQNDSSLIIPAQDIWNSKTGTIAFLETRFENPQERLLNDLGRVSSIYPKIEESLQKTFPTELFIEKDEAFEFLENYSQILEDQGFGVFLPAWWKNPPKDVDLLLNIQPNGEGAAKTTTGIFRLNSFLNFEWEIAIDGTQLSIEEFEKLAELRVPFVRIRGQWIKIDQERINQMLDLIKNKYKRKTISSIEALQLAMTEEYDEDSLFDLSVDETPAFRNFTKRIGASSKIELLLTPENFQGELRHYQIEGFSWMNFLQDYGFGVCLADDMGLGKTIQLIALLLQTKNQRITPLNPSLLICPMSIVGNWLREINRFAPSLNALVYHGSERPNSEEFESILETYDIVITTYNLAQRDFSTLSTIEWYNIILDEAQNIKNPHAKQTRAIKKLESKYKIALTGTPIENRLSELWSIIDFLNPGYLSSLNAFNENYIQPIEKNFDKNKINHLSKIIQPFILRR
ncbi:MAG: SNF2-related protein, partial [Candidatus Heimdallarchaeota archaeon]